MSKIKDNEINTNDLTYIEYSFVPDGQTNNNYVCNSNNLMFDYAVIKNARIL